MKLANEIYALDLPSGDRCIVVARDNADAVVQAPERFRVEGVSVTSIGVAHYDTPHPKATTPGTGVWCEQTSPTTRTSEERAAARTRNFTEHYGRKNRVGEGRGTAAGEVLADDLERAPMTDEQREKTREWFDGEGRITGTRLDLDIVDDPRTPTVDYGGGRTKYGPGVLISLDGDMVATAIDAYLVAHGIVVRGPRTIRGGSVVYVYVDPSGFVIANGERFDGRGPKAGPG